MTFAGSRKLDDPQFEARKAEWNATPSVDVVAELVASVIVLGRTDEVTATDYRSPAAVRLSAEDTSDVSATLRSATSKL